LTHATLDWRALRSAIAGEVVLHDSRDYEAVRRAQMPGFDDIRPQAVVLCSAPADVAEAISFARRCDLEIAVRSGGHCFAGRSSTEGIVIDVTPMRSVSVSGEIATVGAGARLGDVYDALDADGLTIAGGCGPTVGIAGLALGGGLGILGRRHGLTSDQLVGAQVVLADGSVVDCDEHDHDDLFWALRGAGGGQFGVVTSLALRTLPAPRATTLHLIWPHTNAAALIDAWQSWAPGAPDELAASLLVKAGGDPGRPPLVHVFGAMIGTEAATTKLLDELAARAGADPASASLLEAPYREAKRRLAEHGPGEEQPAPAQAFSKSEFFRQPLPTEAVDALVGHLPSGRARGQSRELDFSPWGGAYNRVAPEATAFVHRDELFLLKQAVEIEGGASPAEIHGARDWLARSWGLVHPWGSGGAYPNFPDPDLDDWADAYHGTNLDRLIQVKAKYDPDNVFRFEQSLQGV
jgi:FAD/FMN-containing dehydrogenase